MLNELLCVKAIFSLLKQTFNAWDEHNTTQMGAALAYYTVLSLAPLILLIVGILGLVVEQDSARHEIISQASALMGKDGAATVEAILNHSARQEAGLAATIIGFVVLFIGASGVFAELQDSLNKIWEVTPRTRFWIRLFRKRLQSMVIIFSLGFLVLLSLLFSASIAVVTAFFSTWASGLDLLWEGVNSIVLFILVTLLFASLFRFLPDVRIAWRDVWLGSATTGGLFILGKFLLGFYISRSAFASAYGTAGSIVIVLLWLYYSAQIFFFGAELTRAYALQQGTHQNEVPATPGES